MNCTTCNPPCSYKEENPSSICPFQPDRLVFATTNAGLEAIKNLGGKVPSTLYIGKECIGSLPALEVDGDLYVEGDLETNYPIYVKGNLFVTNFFKCNSKLHVEGDTYVFDHLETREFKKGGFIYISRTGFMKVSDKIAVDIFID